MVLDDRLEKSIAAVMIVGLVFLVMATMALLNDKYSTAIPENSDTTSDTILSNNGTANTLSQTPSGSVTTTVKNRTWLSFDGINDLVTVPNNMLRADTSKSISVWFYTKASGTQRMLYDSSLQNIELRTGNIRWEIWSNVFFNGITTPSLNEWHHLVLTHDESLQNYTMYIDGVIDNSTDTLGSGVSTYTNLNLGSTSSSLNGSLDEIRYYNNYVLNLKEITSVYNSGRKKNESVMENVLFNNNSEKQVIYTNNISEVNNKNYFDSWNTAYRYNNSWIVHERDTNTNLNYGDNNYGCDEKIIYSGWFNISGDFKTMYLVGVYDKNNGILINNSDNTISATCFRNGDTIQNVTWENPNPINDSKWHHIAYWNNRTYYNNGTMALFYDGEKVGESKDTKQGDDAASSHFMRLFEFETVNTSVQADEIRFYYANSLQGFYNNYSIIEQINNSGRIRDDNLNQSFLLMWLTFDKDLTGNNYFNDMTNKTNSYQGVPNYAVKMRHSENEIYLIENTEYTQDETGSFTLLNNTLNYSGIYFDYNHTSMSKEFEVIYLSLNENQGTITYDTSGNSNNGTITGATYQTDDINLSLTEDTDFTQSGTTFTIINDDYSWSQLLLSYGFTSPSTANTVLTDANTNISDNTSIAGIILTLSLLAIVITALMGVFLSLKDRRI